MDRYEKGPSLIGEGPAAPAPQLPIMPPSVGYVHNFLASLGVMPHQFLIISLGHSLHLVKSLGFNRTGTFCKMGLIAAIFFSLK